MDSVNNKKLYDNFFNRYERIKKLGSGSFGKVYLYKNKTTNKKIILKTIYIDKSDKHNLDEVLNLLYVKEKFNNKCLNEVLCIEEYFKKDKKLFIVFKYIGEKSLHDLIGCCIGLSPFIYIFKRLASTLATLHSFNLAHSDIKPNNIIINEKLFKDALNGTFNKNGKGYIIQIVDFGGSCKKEKCHFNGTYRYMSKGYLKSHLDNGRVKIEDVKKTDVYALGYTMFELGNVGFTPYDIPRVKQTDEYYSLLKESDPDKSLYTNGELLGYNKPDINDLIDDILSEKITDINQVKNILYSSF